MRTMTLQNFYKENGSIRIKSLLSLDGLVLVQSLLVINYMTVHTGGISCQLPAASSRAGSLDLRHSKEVSATDLHSQST